MFLRTVGTCIRGAGALLHCAALAQGERETAAAQVMAKRKRILAFLAVSAVVGAGIASVQAAAMPDVIGGAKAYAPAHLPMLLFAYAVIIGFCTGLITGTIGVGGGFIITPALMSVGIKGILAVGTDMFYIFAASIMGTRIHKKLGNVSVPLALTFMIGSFGGVNAGGSINRSLYERNPLLSDTIITSLYVLLLGLLGSYALYDFLRMTRRGQASKSNANELTPIAQRLQSWRVPPLLHFDQRLGGRTLSAWPVLLCGFLVGFMASILGVGGGFLTFPIYVYLLGVSSFTTVGTDTLQIIFTAGYASIFNYAIHGFVFYSLAVGLLIGALVGVQVGAFTTKVVTAHHIKGFYAITILAGFVNRLLALPSKLSSLGMIQIPASLANGLNLVGTVGFLLLVFGFASWVLTVFVRNLPELRKESGYASVQH